MFRSPAAAEIDAVDRGNLAKYLTIAKLRLENVITTVRPEDRAPAADARARRDRTCRQRAGSTTPTIQPAARMAIAAV